MYTHLDVNTKLAGVLLLGRYTIKKNHSKRNIYNFICTVTDLDNIHSILHTYMYKNTAGKL